MTQEKDLLLKDLCMRIPYGVKVQVFNHSVETVETLYQIDLDGYISTIEGDELKYSYKPYLFPVSSMTEEQKKEFDQLIELELKAINDEIDPIQATAFEVNFYNKHHFDWRGLIPMGLAIDATGLNIY